MTLSIQKRLFIILGVFVIANTLLWAGIALLLAYVVEDEIIDRVLSSQIAVVEQNYRHDGKLSSLALGEISLFADLEAVPGHLRGRIDPRVERGEIFTTDKTHYHYHWMPLPGRRPVLMLAEVSPWLVVTYLSPALLILALLGFAVATCLGLLAVYAISWITTRPVRELTDAIKHDPRPDPLPHYDKNDEVGVLASAMDAALTGLQQALARERSFTRDVSHELRTPLTTLRNAIALLPDSLSEDPNVSQLSASSRAIERMLESLLALARAESSILSSLALRAILEGLLLDRETLLEARNFEIDLDVPDEVRVEGNDQLSRLLLGNLLDNALHYAIPAKLRICLEGNSLLLENPIGEGDRAPHVSSLGHGLSLVERLARAQGWRFHKQLSSSRFLVTLSWQAQTLVSTDPGKHQPL